jgi:hypothetical protein
MHRFLEREISLTTDHKQSDQQQWRIFRIEL